MDKRLTKRHKRQVARAKAQKTVSEPDVRTPEQIKAAREASRPEISHGIATNVRSAMPTVRSSRTGSAAKTDA